MRFVHLLFLLCFYLSSFGQNAFNSNDLFTRAYFDKKSSTELIIYDTINGTPIDTIELKGEYCHCIIDINQSQEGWLRIDTLMQMPGCPNASDLVVNYRNHWVKAENFLVDIHEYIEISIYSLPDTNSEIVINVKDYYNCKVLQTNKNWVKVSFIKNEQLIIGWLKPGNYCPYPWTTCP
jgi:hypothetical protein